MASPHRRQPRSDGERSRARILDSAARLATIEGLAGLSLSRLAEASGMSKSGLFAHFGSKEELQLATIDSATRVFERAVLKPAEGLTGMARVRTLANAYLAYVEHETFPGGCFFASALTELKMQPGPVLDELLAFFTRWLAELEDAVRQAQKEGTLAGEDPAQLAFEVEAALFFANAEFAAVRTREPIVRARRMIERRLGV